MARKVWLTFTLFSVFVAAVIGVAAWVMSRAACEASGPPAAALAAAGATGPAAQAPLPGGQERGEYPVPRPPFSEGVFPCSECHNAILPTNPKRRVLRNAHRDIQLHHDEENRWCLDCHNADNHDVLRSASGAPIPFSDSYRLCGQCHGDKYRDWKAGIHGKRTGEWNGEKHYLLCVNCHNPHSPRYKAIEPMPPPVSPEQTR